jgi:hypothetical protein
MIVNELYAQNIKRNFRYFQSNGQATIYLEKHYDDRNGKSTRCIKASPNNVEIIED